MAYILAILASVLLLGAFLALTKYETAKNVRFFGGFRTRMDARAARAIFIIRHVDWSAVIATLVRTGAARIAHDLAHTALIVVRVLERVLTRIVKYLRTRRQQVAATPDRKRFDVRATITQLRANLRRSKEETQDGEMR